MYFAAVSTCAVYHAQQTLFSVQIGHCGTARRLCHIPTRSAPLPYSAVKQFSLVNKAAHEGLSTKQLLGQPKGMISRILTNAIQDCVLCAIDMGSVS